MNSTPKKFDSFEFEKNGVRFKYRIQTATGDHFDEIAEQLGNDFFKEERLCSALNLINDSEASEIFKSVWRDMVCSGTTLIAIIENDCVERGKIIGVNFTYVEKKDEKLYSVSSNKMFNLIIKILSDASQPGNIFEKYNVDRYLAAFGLMVHVDFVGNGIGYRLLESREKLCKLLGLSVTGTIFTGYISQHLATKLGFEVLSSLDDEHIDFGDIECHLDDTKGKDIKFMALKYT
ncbi:uncharacterized protein LOC126834273 [Adelges cooleyi]|uniref:uncharacterized protein LOC126834273 n=1 Tax=Adelges cooleyi TaxID=133065 RepID=UPI00217FA555|nr:uncharacterized protein LOC126834273 [Adelges cooleyi]